MMISSERHNSLPGREYWQTGKRNPGKQNRRMSGVSYTGQQFVDHEASRASRKVAPMSKLTSSRSFVNLRWQVNGETRLSVSEWTDSSGYTTFAVALLRKCGSKWEVAHETAAEFRDKDVEDIRYRSTDFGAKLVAQVLGECPLRFFRDAAL